MSNTHHVNFEVKEVGVTVEAPMGGSLNDALYGAARYCLEHRVKTTLLFNHRTYTFEPCEFEDLMNKIMIRGET